MSINPSITTLINEIKSDKTHGASELARQAAGVLKTSAERSQARSTAEFLAEQAEVGEHLMSARPAMAPVFNIVSRLLGTIKEASSLSLDSARHLTITTADQLIEDSLNAVARIAQTGAELISQGDIILTHSYSSTVVAALQSAFTRYGNIEVIATRSGPGRSGERTARELGRHGVLLTFIDDTATGLYISKANKVIVGADRICADGSVVNGIGSYQLAVLTHRAGIPFYVLGESLKFDPRQNSNEVNLEEKDPSEVVEPGLLPAAVRVKNPYFDITPLELVTAVVTESGVLTPAEVIGYMAELSRQAKIP